MLISKLKFIYEGAKTKRFHTADTLTAQTVGEHSFGVAWLVLLIAPNCRKEVLCAALAHDLAEHLVGDVPSPAKRQFPALGEAVNGAEEVLLLNNKLDFEVGLTPQELRVVKLADNLDGMMFCVRERRMGSKVVVGIYNNFYDYTNEMLRAGEPAYELFVTINEMWEKYHDGQ